MNNSVRVLTQTAEEELKAPLSGSVGSNAGAEEEENFMVDVSVVADGGDEEDAMNVVGLADGQETGSKNGDDDPSSGELMSDKETATMISSTEGSSSPNGADEIIKPKEGDESDPDPSEEKNPWTMPYIGIPVNYFSVGVILGGSVSVLYPILIIQNGVTSSFYSAASSLVTIFWSYKIVFGILCDCFPVAGLKWKPYIIGGWVSLIKKNA